MSICFLADASSIHTKRWATEFARRGYQIDVLSFLPGEIPGGNVHVFDAGPIHHEGGNWRYLAHLPALHKAIRHLQPDLLHAHYLTSYGLLGALSGYHPLVLTAWGSDVLVTPTRNSIYRLLLRFTLARADLVTSDAATMSQRILTYGLPEDRLLNVPLGIDLRKFNTAARDWPIFGSRIISTRHLVPNSNIDTLLEAFERTCSQMPALQLNVIGEGPERAHLEERSRQLGIENKVTWCGWIENDLLPHRLREADIYVAITTSDSTSVSLLEAMACGAFPIVSNLPANREWIEHRVNGLIVAPQDSQALAEAIQTAADNPELRKRAGVYNSDLIAKRANWQRNMDNVEEAYQDLIRSR
jgi:glycosyltransferase involved in cell wall biosynthesis